MLNRIARQFVAITTLGTLALSLATASAQEGSGKVRTLALPNGGQPVSAKVDSKGTIHVLYDSPAGPGYMASTDNGKTFGKPIAVVDHESRKPGLEFHAWDMAVGKGDRVHVALGTNAWKLKLPKEEWGCFYASLDPGAKSFSPLRNINGKPSEGFSLAADKEGRVTACWLSGKLYANVSRDRGETWDKTVEINPDYNPCDCCTTSATYGADGKLAVLYREETNNERDMFLVLWDQVQNKTSRTRVSGTSWKIEACPMSYYQVSPNKDGYVAIWPTKNQIYFAHLERQGAPTKLAEIKTPGQSGMRTGMFALNATNGRTLVAWKNENQLGWQIYDERGQPAGTPGSTSSAGKGAAGVITKEGAFVLFR